MKLSDIVGDAYYSIQKFLRPLFLGAALAYCGSADVAKSNQNKTEDISDKDPNNYNNNPRAIQVAVTHDYSCALLNDGTVRCWGSGQATSTELTAKLRDVTQISLGYHHGCALLTDRTVRCWGSNNRSQLGDGTNERRDDAPVLVSNLTNVVQVEAGGYVTCAVLTDGTARCWGEGEFGDGTTKMYRNSSVPVFVSGLKNAVEVAVGDLHACALLTDGTARCWGEGVLGNDELQSYYSKTPVRVSKLTDAIQIELHYYSCALLEDSTVKCWGDHGNLRTRIGNECDGVNVSCVVPYTIPVKNVAQLATGGEPVCALFQDNAVRCWDSEFPPILVPGITNAIQVATGRNHSCAIIANGNIYCWGNNEDGQLGDGTKEDRSIPVKVKEL